MFDVVEFPSQGALLRGRFYRPERAAPFPVVVMTHGTTATITMALDHYAEVFCRAGLAVLLYDHRNFGLSGGEPRQQINPWIQARGYRDAVNYLLTRSDVRADRIAAWGDSYSGMIALAVGPSNRASPQCSPNALPAVRRSRTSSHPTRFSERCRRCLPEATWVAHPKRRSVRCPSFPSIRRAHRRY